MVSAYSIALRAFFIAAALLLLVAVYRGLETDAAAIADDGADYGEGTPTTSPATEEGTGNRPHAPAGAALPMGHRGRICKSCFWLPTCDKIKCTEEGTECFETPQTCRECGTARCYPKK
ncbi:hypothetical protein SYNPS1DRAFT_28668 [Syncephalis pseudoplumigaleata]|uniref:Membrane anchor Opy2 N-terminal domain-containing protein n=1 Tax=Syncephalis pseudoplumigaleata TaxID=1712513 RepID=A0A4P9Z2C0_9FUNG|nr:hypothetical protein SYNPS1DRAFT_28668 [Syncephalis pseudoplumigaleata]|eukprot:RKP25600.1 hypothetical protein SYNPS1DRAFT_28668 [Syncephalis pseudoplumigaleata]